MSLGPSKRKKGPRKPVRGLGYLPDVQKKPKRIKARRSDPRPGNRPMTAEESAHVEEAKTTKCIPCLVWAEAGNMQLEDVATCAGYDHKKSGNIRRGHLFGFASCDWHHQKIKPDNWTFAGMTKRFGPSLMDGSKLFAETYGSDDELIQRQNELLYGEEGP